MCSIRDNPLKIGRYAPPVDPHRLIQDIREASNPSGEKINNWPHGGGEVKPRDMCVSHSGYVC